MKKFLSYGLIFFLVACSQDNSVDSKLAKGQQLFYDGQYEHALRILDPLAKNGNSTAQFLSGKAHHFGLFVDVDQEKAKEYYTKASDENTSAKHNLALLMMQNPSERYKRRAMLMFQEIMDEEVLAYLNYISFSLQDTNTLEEANKIISEVEKEAKFGDIGANFTLGRLYRDGYMHPSLGPAIKIDRQKSTVFFEKIKSNDRALDELLTHYANSENNSKDEVFQIAKRLSAQGYPNSKSLLGYWYVFGNEVDKKLPVKRDLDVGRNYLFQASELGSSIALSTLTMTLDTRKENDLKRYRKIVKNLDATRLIAFTFMLGSELQFDELIDFLTPLSKKDSDDPRFSIWVNGALAKTLYGKGEKDEAIKLANLTIAESKDITNNLKPGIMIDLINAYFVLCTEHIINSEYEKAKSSCLAHFTEGNMPFPSDPLIDPSFYYTLGGYDPISRWSIGAMLGSHSLALLADQDVQTKDLDLSITRLKVIASSTLQPPFVSLTNVAIARLYKAKENFDQAIIWALKGVESDPNNAFALQTLIEFLLESSDLNDIALAMATTKDLANLKNPSNASAETQINWAKSFLGAEYLRGERIDKDVEKAIFWLTKASEAGSDVASGNLGLIYLKEEEYRDIKKAEKLFIQSINNGNNYFEGTLGDMYVRGWNGSDELKTKENFEKGLEMLKNYIQRKELDYDRLLVSYFSREMYDGSLEDESVLCRLTDLSADNNETLGLAMKGSLHVDGTCDFGRTYNDINAIRNLQKASNSSSNTAAYYLGNIYRDGEITRENLSLSKSYYDKAEKFHRSMEENTVSKLLNLFSLEEINSERNILNSKIRIAEAKKRNEEQKLAKLREEERQQRIAEERRREQRLAAERRRKNASDTPFLDFLVGIAKVAAVVAAVDFVVDNAPEIVEALAESQRQDYSWDWDYFRSNRQWRCRGIQTGRFAENWRCQYKLKDDDRWPHN